MPKVVSVLGDAARSATRIDRSQIAPDVGLRAALGVALCLVVGRATGHTVAGVTATIGALNGGMASHQGTYRSRAWVILAAAAACGLCAAVGAEVGHLFGPDVVVTAVIAFFAALLVSLGPAGSVVGIQAVVGLVVFSQFDFPLAVAARDGGLVLLGGGVQAALVVLLWPLRRFPAERRALGAAYSALSGYARAAAADPLVMIEAGAMDALGAMWRDSQPFGGDEIAARRLLAVQSDRLRLELVALVRARGRLEARGQAGASEALDGVLTRTGAVLGEVAAALREGRAPSGWGEDRVGFQAAREALRRAAETGPGQWVGPAAEEAERRVDALAGQLRAILRTAAQPAGVSDRVLDEMMAGGPTATAQSPRSGATWARERLATLRSNLTLSSQACRHALRMSAALAVAVVVSHALPYAHHYWVPMTAMLVLRPDFTSTITRGISRVVGTLFGAGLVTLALAELRPGPVWLIVLVVLLCFPATTLVLANYAVYSVCIASLVVTLLAFTGNPEVATAGDRSIYTVIGALIAFAAYVAWPTWEGTSLPDTLAGLAATEGRYAAQVLRAWAAPESADAAALQRIRLEARLARGNAEAAVSRWLGEPRVAGELGPETVLAYMASIRRCVQALLALHAELPATGPGHPGAAVLADGVERAFAAIADQVKGSPPVGPFPLLRKEQLALAASLPVGGDAGPDRVPAVVLIGETDLLVDSVDALGHLFGLVG